MEKKIPLSKILLTFFSFWVSFPALALVSSPATVSEGKSALEVKAMVDRGKVEPNENMTSYQSANINIYQLSFSRGLSSPGFGFDHFIRVEYRYFNSGKEQVGSQVFYEKDSGHVASVSYGFNFVHERAFSAGMYLSVSPLAVLDRNKFSNPRVDWVAAGLKSGVELSNSFFLEHLVHFGSGLPPKQNSYLAFAQNLGFKMKEAVSIPVSIRAGPYVEVDLRDRFDSKYDSVFSAPGRTDRIRSVKMGVFAGLDLVISENWYGTLGYIQKLGGYDAPATNATYGSLGLKW